MNTNAAFAHESLSCQPRGQHVRNDKRETVIRVLACPGAEPPRPRHARAIPAPERLLKSDQRVKRLQGLSGISYNLSKSDRAFAIGAGAVFAMASLAVTLL